MRNFLSMCQWRQLHSMPCGPRLGPELRVPNRGWGAADFLDCKETESSRRRDGGLGTSEMLDGACTYANGHSEYVVAGLASPPPSHRAAPVYRRNQQGQPNRPKARRPSVSEAISDVLKLTVMGNDPSPRYKDPMVQSIADQLAASKVNQPSQSGPWWTWLIIDPRTSKRLGFWDAVTSIALVFTAIVTPMEVGFLRSARPPPIP